LCMELTMMWHTSYALCESNIVHTILGQGRIDLVL
jgi:hypothetical protein